MSTNHQPRKFSIPRYLRYVSARTLLTALFLVGFNGGGFVSEDALSNPSPDAQTVGDCYEWEYINGEWTLVRVPC